MGLTIIRKGGKTDWMPSGEGDYYRWNLPAEAWSGADNYDETIKIVREAGRWWAQTECDQCTHRDLTQEEIATVRVEFELDQWIGQ